MTSIRSFSARRSRASRHIIDRRVHADPEAPRRRARSPSILYSPLSILLLPCLAPAQPPPAPNPPEPPPAPVYTCALDARFDRLEESHYLPVKGTTSLPDGALLTLEAYYLKPPSAIFIRPDRPPPPPDEYALDSATVAVQDGRFEARLWIVKRTPYPGTYRIRAAIHWPDQPAFFRGENPDEREPLGWAIELTRGTADELAAEREAVRAAVKADIDRLRELQRDLARRFRSALADRAAAAGWEAWAASWREPIGPMKARNAERIEAGVLWSETQGKYRVQDLTERVEALAEACAAALRGPAASAPSPEIALQEEHFQAIYEGALNLLGFLKPVEPELVRRHLAPIASDFERVAQTVAGIAAPAPPSSEGVERLREEILVRLQAGLSALLPGAPEQAVEPATAYTEALMDLLNDAARIVPGDAKAGEAILKKLAVARAHLQTLQGMMTRE